MICYDAPQSGLTPSGKKGLTGIMPAVRVSVAIWIKVGVPVLKLAYVYVVGAVRDTVVLDMACTMGNEKVWLWSDSLVASAMENERQAAKANKISAKVGAYYKKHERSAAVVAAAKYYLPVFELMQKLTYDEEFAYIEQCKAVEVEAVEVEAEPRRMRSRATQTELETVFLRSDGTVIYTV